MRNQTHPIKKSLLALAMLLVLLTSACASAVNANAPTQTHNVAASNTSQLGEPTVRFELKTALVEGKMAFIGTGDLDGQVNPDLVVQPGDVVEITLTIGDGMLHDWSAPDFGAATEQISETGKQSVVTFAANQEGTFAYFCSVPGHRQAGMEGRLIVGAASDMTSADSATSASASNSIVRAPDDLPAPLNRATSETVRVDLETTEVEARLADGTAYKFWTFNGKLPGPFVRVRVGDTVEVHLKNAANSQFAHSVDFHAVTGPGGGAVATQTKPGEETMFTFKALNPGLFVYHCATPMVAHHISNGMYGLILVEPEGGLEPVDHEFYVMQGEVYTAEDMGTKGVNTFSVEKLLDEQPEYFTFNGAVGALTEEHPLTAKTGETVRIFFGVGGPNFTSSFHVIGEIFDRVYDQASLTSAPLTNVQTTLVPPGGATIVEFGLEVPGRYILVDHALSRMERGLTGYLIVEGPDNPEVFHGEVTTGSGH